jgi:hypothetical protein
MVWMVLVLVAVVVVAALAVAVFLRLRPRGGDLDSVRSYHSALGTLEHLGDRVGQSSVRVAGSAEREAESHVRPRIDPGDVGAPHVPPVPVRQSDEFPDPSASPLVFDDARPGDAPRNQPPHEGAGPLRADRAHRHALESMNHRPRRTTAVVLTVIVLALFAVLAYSGSRRSKSTTTSRSSHTSVPTTGAAHPIRTTSPTSTASPTAHRSRPGQHGTHRATTTTTAPARIVAVSTSTVAATYPVTASGSYQLSLSASGPCWVLARSVATGATVWTGTLQAGGTQGIRASGAVTLELGALGTTVTLDGVPVVLPSPMHTPFVATFQPAAPGTSTGTTSSTGSSSSSGFSTTVPTTPSAG